MSLNRSDMNRKPSRKELYDRLSKREKARIKREIDDAMNTIIRNKEHFGSVWLDMDWSGEKSDIAYLINKGIQRNR